MGKDEKFEKRRISLDVLDQNKSVDQEDYRVKLKEYQLRLLNLQRVLMESRHSVVVVVEGPDAAGKQSNVWSRNSTPELSGFTQSSSRRRKSMLIIIFGDSGANYRRTGR
jgi:polyphosphate kinase 2 (PPK2 family)